MSGVIRKKEVGQAWETVEDTGGGGSQSSLTTPDAAGNTDPITVKTGDSSAGNSGGINILSGDAFAVAGGLAGDIQIAPGDTDPATGTGGSIILRPGSGVNNGLAILQSTDGDAVLATGDIAGTEALQFFGTSIAVQQTVTGALSTVADAPAKAVLTSIIAALAAYGLVIDGTT